MECLLQNLHEQQIHLQHLYFYDLANMENINDGKPPLPPPHQYVSIFRIDGEPILPPLMTTEKRRQMQKLKVKALEIEQRLKERKKGVHGKYYDCNEGITRENSSSSSNQTSGSITQLSLDYDESAVRETELSMALLKKLIQKQQERREDNCTETAATACNVSAHVYRDDNREKLKKLQKSEILIYDNSTNEVIQVPAEKQDIPPENPANSNQKPNKNPSHLLLAGVSSKGMTSTPSICLNPPTPLADKESLNEILSATESNESLLNSENLNQSLDFGQDLSSDDSFNSMITQSDIKSNRNTQQQNTKFTVEDENSKNFDENSHTPVKNVCAKIQQFEAVSSDTNTPPTSPQKLQKNRKFCLRTPAGTMNRSATSPSIKTTASNRSSSSRSQSLAQDSDNSPENALVRSSSFTLEGPSKALIEHMQQQKVINESKPPIKSPLHTIRNLPRNSPASPLRAYRDTVESKAKKVQKVELRSSKQKIQQKTSQSKFSQPAAATTSRSIPTTPTTLNQHVNNLCKTKRSPYDISKTSHTSLQTQQKTSSTQLRKSNSSNLNQSKAPKTRLIKSCTSTSYNSSGTARAAKVPLNQMDKVQKDKFLKLLVQQEEEHRRLQQSFERQQRLLIEQLNREMATSPNNSHHSSSTTATSQRKRFTNQQQILSPKQLFQINSSAHALDHSTQKPTISSFDSIRHNGQTNYHEASSSISNNNSSYIDKNQSQNLNSHQHYLHNLHYTQSPKPNHLNHSPLSLTDRSNANTSLDISTLSIQTSPDSVIDQNHAACATTVDNNKTPPSSRRRLFTTETIAVGVDNNSARSTYTSSACFVEQGKRLQQLNYTDDSSNRRNQIENSLLLHAAATKINAYARGFLVRRLFRTEHIQRIVQTIRDTLIFVLNLHIETIENPEEGQTPANIKLKARLLQQLSSACRSLHLVFFQSSIKERMEIIARDRKRIKNKLMSVNRKRTPGLAA